MAKKNKRNDSYLSIRKKLIAAVAMLLVASFMVASSSYAWFTLSTAPEVTGIQTSVGANGSLEIALYKGTDPTSSVGDGADTKTALEKNITWGNQINLSDNAYGLQKISLYPSRLNLISTGTDSYQIDSIPLLTPEYAADGRVKSLEKNTVLGIYDSTNAEFNSSDELGVRAIGTVSGMTKQEVDWRAAKAAINTATNTAKSAAQTSLSENADALASLAVLKAAEQSESKYDISFVYSSTINGEDITESGMVADLKKANTAIGEAIVAYVKAAIALSLATDENYDTISTALESVTIDSITVSGSTWTVAGQNVTVLETADVAKAYAIYSANKATLEQVKTDATAVADLTQAEWTDVQTVLYPLVNIDRILVNGYTATELTANISTVVGAILNGGIKVELPGSEDAVADDPDVEGDQSAAAKPSSGIYADIAEVCGNYSVTDVTITIPAGTYKGFNFAQSMDMPAQMHTTAKKHYDLYTAAGNTAPEGNGNNTAMTDFYGYIVDLAFRTNAQNSKLMLQTTPVDRISSSGSTDSTMGGGSTMNFTIDTSKYTVGQALELMKSIRIVFTNENNEIIAMGGLGSNATVEDNKITADIYLFEFTAADDGNGYKITIGNSKGTNEKGAQELTALNQNEITPISVYVYLDGDEVENGDVANAAQSMSGTLNLQFSSSEVLVPMDYTFGDDLVKNEDTITETVTMGADQLTGGTYTIKANQRLNLPATDASSNAITWKLGTGYDSVATLAGTSLTPKTTGTVQLQYTIDGVTNNFTITIEAAAQAPAGGGGA